MIPAAGGGGYAVNSFPNPSPDGGSPTSPPPGLEQDTKRAMGEALAGAGIGAAAANAIMEVAALLSQPKTHTATLVPNALPSNIKGSDYATDPLIANRSDRVEKQLVDGK